MYSLASKTYLVLLVILFLSSCYDDGVECRHSVVTIDWKYITENRGSIAEAVKGKDSELIAGFASRGDQYIDNHKYNGFEAWDEDDQVLYSFLECRPEEDRNRILIRLNTKIKVKILLYEYNGVIKSVGSKDEYPNGHIFESGHYFLEIQDSY